MSLYLGIDTREGHSYSEMPAQASPFPFRNGIVHRASKPIIHYTDAVEGHEVITGGFQILSCRAICYA